MKHFFKDLALFIIIFAFVVFYNYIINIIKNAGVEKFYTDMVLDAILSISLFFNFRFYK